MSAAQIHLALNHFPIAGIILSFPILLWGLIAKKEQIKIVGIAMIFVASLSAFAVMQTGDGAEEIVEHKPLVTKNLIHEHDEAAEKAMAAIQACAVLSIAWIVLNKKNHAFQDKVLYAILVVNLAGAGLVANAAHLGGMIRHDELRSGQAATANVQVEKAEHEENEKKENNEANEKK